MKYLICAIITLTTVNLHAQEWDDTQNKIWPEQFREVEIPSSAEVVENYRQLLKKWKITTWELPARR